MQILRHELRNLLYWEATEIGISSIVAIVTVFEDIDFAAVKAAGNRECNCTLRTVISANSGTFDSRPFFYSL